MTGGGGGGRELCDHVNCQLPTYPSESIIRNTEVEEGTITILCLLVFKEKVFFLANHNHYCQIWLKSIDHGRLKAMVLPVSDIFLAPLPNSYLSFPTHPSKTNNNYFLLLEQ